MAHDLNGMVYMWSIHIFAILSIITSFERLWEYSLSWILLTITSYLSHSYGTRQPDIKVFVADRIAIAILIVVGCYHYCKSFSCMNRWQRVVPFMTIIAVGCIHFLSNLKWPEKFIIIHVITGIGHLPIIEASSKQVKLAIHSL